MGKKGTKKRTQWRTLSITEQDELNATTAAGTAHISNGNSTTGINIDEASSVDDNFKYSGTNFSYLKRKSSAFSPSSNNFNNNNNSNRNDNFRINSYNTNSSYYYNNKHNSSSINNNNFIAINTTSNASSVNNDTTLNSNNIRYTRSLSSSSRYSSNNNNNTNNNNNSNNLNSNNRRNKPYSMQNGGSSLSSKYYSSYGTGRATSRANRTSSYSSYNTRNNLNKTLSNNELSSSTSSSTTNANKENYPKPLFNEDDYTRITTPRQDVIFKKGYLSRPKPSYLSSTDTNTTSSATASIVSEESISTATSVPSSLSPEQCSSVHSDSIVDPEQAFMYSYIDQNGILYVNPFVPPPNGFDPYPGQMFMMPCGYSPYNFCPPDLNTPSISDVDNEIIENEEISIKDTQKTKDETDENKELNTEDIEEISITETENGESKDNLPQNTENQDVDKTINTKSIAEDDTESSKISSEIKDESVNTNPHILTIDQNNQQPNKCYHHSYMRNNCDPNFFNYGYGGPPIYPQIYYPINYYGGPPIMPLMGPPPYEIHPEMINEELITNEEEEKEAVVDGKQGNSNLTKVEKIESTDSTITLKSKEAENSPSEENTNLTKDMSAQNEALQTLSEEAVVATSKTEIVENAIQTSNINVQSCDADDINLSITQETENKQQLNLNVNVDEFVPRTVTIKPHLNVNVKEFQPRYIKQNNNNIITIKNPSLNRENKPNLKLILNQNQIDQSSRSNELKKDLKTEKLSMQNLSINKNQNKNDSAKENTNTNNTISESNQIQKSSQKPATTLAEQIKRTLAIQNDNKIVINCQPQTKIFQNNNNSNQIKNVDVNYNKVEQKEQIKSSNNIKSNEKLSKSGKKSNNKIKNNRNISNETSDKNNNNNKNKNLNNSIPKPSESCNTVEEKEELLVIATNLKKSSTQAPPTTNNNVLSYAQMLNKDLKAAEDKTNSIEQITPTTNSTNPANSTVENELDDTEVQELIKSLETAEKLTAIKENICWQTVKSRGKRSKYQKEINNNNHEQEYTEEEVDIQQREISPVIEQVTIIPSKEDNEKEKVSEINKDQNINNTNDEVEQNQQIENGENSSTESSSINKSIEKKKLKQKNKKTTKKSPNAKKSSPKEKLQKESESSNEGSGSGGDSSTFNKVKINLFDEGLNIDKNMNVEDIDDNTLALKLYEDLEKELNMKIESDACDDDEEELEEKIIGKSPDILMKHSSLGRNLDMINGFDYKFKTKNILKEEEEMVLNVIKSLSSNSSSSSPIGCNKKSDNIFNASFIALNGCNSQPSSVSAAFNNFENKTTLCEDPKNLIRKSSCSANTNVSTQSCGKSKQENNNIELNNTASGVDIVLNTVADKQHEDSNGIKTATVPTSPVKKDEANSEYIQNCIKESLNWIKKMESVEKTIDNLDEAQTSINEKVLNINKDKLDLSLYLSQQDKKKESEKSSGNDTALVQKSEKIKPEKSADKGSGKSKSNRNKLGKKHMQDSTGKTLTNKETLNHMDEIDNTVTSEEQKHNTQFATVEQILLENETINNIKEIESIEKFIEKKVEDLIEPHILVEPTNLMHPNEYESIPNGSGDTNPNISLNFELNEKESEEIFETTANVPIEVTSNGDSQTSNEPEEPNNQGLEETSVDEKEIQIHHLKDDENEHIKDEITLFKATEVNEHLENEKKFNSDKIVTCSVDEESPTKGNLICDEINSKTTTLEGKHDVENGNITLTDSQLYHQLDAKTEEENFENTLVEYETENQIVDDDMIILHIETDSFQNGESVLKEKEIESQSTMVKLDTTISNKNEIIEEAREIIAKESPTTNIVRDLMQNSFTDIDTQLEHKINGSKSIKDETSNGHEHQDQDYQLEKKLNSELLYNCHTTNENSITLNGLNSLDKSEPSLKHNNSCHLPNGVRKECSSESEKNEQYQIEETDFGFVKEINKAEIPLYHNNLIFNRQRLSHSVSDSNDDTISLSGLEKQKSTSSLALQLQQLEEQLKKLDRLATPPLVHDETRNGFYNSENDFNSLESSETNSSTLEDSLTSPRNETINDGYVSNSSGNEFHIYDPESTVCNIKINEPIVNDVVCVIDLDLNSSNSSNRNSKDCDSLNVTNLKNSNENCMKRFPFQSETNELQISVASQHDSEKFPLTFAVKNWLAQENKEKTPEPILRLPDDPNLHTRIKSSLSLHQLNDDDDDNDGNYYQEDDCWSLTTDSEVNFNELTENAEAEETETETETEEQKIEILKNENKIKKSKNLKSNPLHVSSVKTDNNPNQYQLNKHQNDNDSDYNSDSQIPHIYDDNTCERVAAPIKKNFKSDENISTTSEQQIDYFWDDFVENPLKYLKNSKENNNNKNCYKNINNNVYNNNLRNTDITILDTSESMFSSGTSSMNELHDLTPYESVYGKSINYDKLLESNYELLSNNIINFNKTNCNYKNGNLNNDNDHADDKYAEKNIKNILNKKFQKKQNSIAINNIDNDNDNENDTSLNKNINLNNNENCIKPPEVCCILM